MLRIKETRERSIYTIFDFENIFDCENALHVLVLIFIPHFFC